VCVEHSFARRAAEWILIVFSEANDVNFASCSSADNSKW
jgi:hypothetical protein